MKTAGTGSGIRCYIELRMLIEQAFHNAPMVLRTVGWSVFIRGYLCLTLALRNSKRYRFDSWSGKEASNTDTTDAHRLVVAS